MNRFYNKEQIEEWASKRADDAGRLSRQLLDIMRKNERLREALYYAKQWLCIDESVPKYNGEAEDLQQEIDKALSNMETSNG